MSSTFHSSFGPAAGHCFNSPVSNDLPSWLGPSQLGQSEPAATASEAMIASAQNEERMRVTVFLLIISGVGIHGRKGSDRRVLACVAATGIPQRRRNEL